jgi:hypothetical protein
VKVLYVTTGTIEGMGGYDCLALDMFHGLASCPDVDLVDIPDQEEIYCGGNPALYPVCRAESDTGMLYDDDFRQHRYMWKPSNLVGMPSRPTVDRTEIDKKIRDRYFDAIIWGSFYRIHTYWDLSVESGYSQSQLIVIDGEDNSKLGSDAIQEGFWDDYGLTAGKAIFFKLHLRYDWPTVQPITIGIPEEWWFDALPEKDQIRGQCIPSCFETYTFRDRESYFADYRRSYFGLTWMKNGVDTQRHGEILANHSLPLFLEADQIPPRCMTMWPKDKLVKILQLPGLRLHGFEYGNPFYVRHGEVELGPEFDFNQYYDLLEDLYWTCRPVLTSRKMAEYVLSFLT